MLPVSASFFFLPSLRGGGDRGRGGTPSRVKGTGDVRKEAISPSEKLLSQTNSSMTDLSVSCYAEITSSFTHYTEQQSPSSPQSAKVLQDEQHDGSGNPSNTHAPRHRRSTAASTPSPQDWTPLALA